MWYVHIMEHYSALNKEILSHVTIWMNLKYIILSKISQLKRDKNCMIPLMRYLSKVSKSETESRKGLPRTGGRRKGN